MKVLLISPLPPPAGGIASWTKRYLNSEIAQEHEVDIVNIAVKGERVNNFTQKKKISEELTRFLSILKELKQKLKEKKYDIVHMNSSCSKTGLLRDLAAAYAVKKSGTKLLVHFRCDVTFMLKSRLSVCLFDRIVKLSDSVITLNKVSHDYILDRLGVESVILPNYISDDYIMESNSEKDINEEIKRLIFVGHVTDEKGCDLIYDLAKEFPQKEFVLVGHVSAEFLERKKTDNVCLKGEMPLEAVKDEYKKSDVFLFPTHTEGFPNVVSEAMSCGMPIIATPVGAIPDMIEEYGGLIAHVNNKQEFTVAINKMENVEMRKKMSEFNRNKVKQYTINTIMEQLFKIYKD